jgi:hypothetical protein
MNGSLNKVVARLPGKLKYFISYSISYNNIPNLFNPRDYREYIFRDIFLNKNHKRYILADKYRVRDIIKKKGLGHILPRIYGCWKNAGEIEFERLPERFVLKTNHSCNFNIICHNKNNLDYEKTRKKLNYWLNSRHGFYFESHYHKIKPLVICEEYIDDKKGIVPVDYKFHCVHGEPVLILVINKRFINIHSKMLVFDINWNRLDFLKPRYIDNTWEISAPPNLERMKEYARILSSGMKHVRIDFYDTGDRVFFGEYTLTPAAGILHYFTDEALKYMGDQIRDPKKQTRIS